MCPQNRLELWNEGPPTTGWAGGRQDASFHTQRTILAPAISLQRCWSQVTNSTFSYDDNLCWRRLLHRCGDFVRPRWDITALAVICVAANTDKTYSGATQSSDTRLFMVSSERLPERLFACQEKSYNPFTPKSEQFQISSAASPEISHHTVWRTWLFIDYSDERWLHYQFAVPHLCIWLIKVGRMYFSNLGVKGLICDNWSGRQYWPKWAQRCSCRMTCDTNFMRHLYDSQVLIWSLSGRVTSVRLLLYLESPPAFEIRSLVKIRVYATRAFRVRLSDPPQTTPPSSPHPFHSQCPPSEARTTTWARGGGWRTSKVSQPLSLVGHSPHIRNFTAFYFTFQAKILPFTSTGS